MEKIIVYVCPSSSAFLRHHSFLAIEAAKRHIVHAVLAFDEESRGRVLSDAGITVHGMELSRDSANPMRVLGEARALRRILKRLNPDVVNAVNLKAVLVSALANAGRSSRLVGTIPGLGYMFIGNSPKQIALRNATLSGLRLTLARQDHLLIFSNADDAGEFTARKTAEADRMRIIPVPGVDVTEFTPSPEPASGFRVVLPARMLWDKGVGEFVAAAADVRARLPEARFLLAGAPDPGNPSSISEKQLKEWARTGAVEWLGQCRDMAGLFAGCHVVCLPSKYREGFPRVLAEGMACGRAVLTTDTPGCRAIGPDAGIVVEPGNVGALVEGLVRLHGQPCERREFARRGRERAVGEFNRELITANLLAAYT